MVEERTESRELNLRQMLPWTELFRGFQVAIDPKKLALAAAGILVMALGWWLLAIIFASISTKPQWGAPEYQSGQYDGADEAERREKAWKKFKLDRKKWATLYEAAGSGGERIEAGDLADSIAEHDELTKVERATRDERVVVVLSERYKAGGKLNQAEKVQLLAMGAERPYGRLRTWPWLEDRGPNPYLLVTGQAGVPWEAGRFWDWFLTRQVPNLIEPLVKFLLPVLYLLRSDLGLLNTLYFLLVVLVTVATWALFGGAITRMAVVEVARREKMGLTEALTYAARRYTSYLTAPLFPLGIVALVVLLLILFFGLPQLVPVFGDLWSGVLWPLPLLAGLAIAVLLVGLVGWPMMSAAISAEGPEGSWEAVSRMYSYVYQAPWHFLWYAAVALVYGAVIVFFVGFMGSFMAYLAKWGVSRTPLMEYTRREPSYLFVYAPTSFGWRTLLLDGYKVEGQDLVERGVINEALYERLTSGSSPSPDRMTWYNKVGAFLVSVYLYLLFLFILGFGYSYFWTAGTIVYLLMRKQVDDAELDEVYFEEEDQEPVYRETAAPPPAPAAPPPPMLQLGTAGLKPPPPAPAPAPPADAPKPAPSPEPTSSAKGDGAPPVTGGS